MIDIREKLNGFRKRLIEKPLSAFWTIFFILILILIILPLINNLSTLISTDLLYLILKFIILNVIFGFFAFYFIPFILHLPDGKQTIQEYLKTLKLTKNHLSLKIIFLGLVLGFSVLIGLFITGIILGEPFLLKLDFNQVIGSPNIMNLSWFHFIYHIVPALWEEIFFRGLILTILLKVYSVRNAIILDGLLFGLFHSINEASLIVVGQVIYNIFSGITLAYVYVKTSNLIPCIIAHYINNILSALVFASYEVNILLFLYQAGLNSLIVLLLRFGILKLYEKLGMNTAGNKII